MSTQQASLGAFQSATAQQSEESEDGLHALGARLQPGFTTLVEQEDRSHDRLVSEATCSLCGQFHGDSGVCPEREAAGELADDPVRGLGGAK